MVNEGEEASVDNFAVGIGELSGTASLATEAKSKVVWKFEKNANEFPLKSMNLFNKLDIEVMKSGNQPMSKGLSQPKRHSSSAVKYFSTVSSIFSMTSDHFSDL